jgi:hypothetical protein
MMPSGHGMLCAMKTARLLATLTMAVIFTAACGPASTSTSAAPSTTRPATTSTSPGTAATAPNRAQPADVAVQVAATRAMLAQLQVGGRGPKTGYERTVVFGPAWADVDANGCGTRDDILSRDLVSVSKLSSCVVVGGTLHDPYTGRDIPFSKANAIAVQIDHVVPLSLAWQLGAAQWPQGERVTFANDPANLLAVDGPTNEQKSDSGPDSWLPANKTYRCTYVIRFARVVSAYKLRLTASMRDAISTQLDNCGAVVGDPASLRTLPPSVWDRAAQLGGGSSTSSDAAGKAIPVAPPAQPTAGPGGSDVYYANCTAVRAAGKAPLHRGDPGYRAGLDRDGDGVACE